MKNILKFIYNREDKGIYRIRTILGIRITTKPKNLLNNLSPFVIKFSNYKTKKYKLAVFLRFGIGDYILFRKFLPYIRDYYKEYNITLIGNSIWSDILYYFDKDYIDEYISYQGYHYPPTAFKDYFENIEYDILISHFYGHDDCMDTIISYMNAKEKIGSYGSLWNNTRFNRAKAFTIYDKFIKKNIDDDERVHEITRNINFFEELLNRKIDINDMNIELDKSFFDKIDFDFNDKYCILFPFSVDKLRIWDNRMFAEIIDYLYSKYEITSYIVGSKDNILEADDIVNNCFDTKYAKNICGKYKLNELFYIFNKAKLIISIDSAGYHIGIAVNDNVICITSGLSYNRYLNYPKELIKNKNINIVLPKELEKDIKNNSAKIDYQYYPLYDLQSIEPEYICELIDDRYKL